MEYNKGRGGKWLDTSELKDGQKAKIVDECTKQVSKFKDKDGNDKTENVAKVRFEGMPEAVNTRINWTTIYGLIEAFGPESKSWTGHVLTVKLIDAMVGDTMRTLLYLIPNGFELAKNADKKLEIRRIGGAMQPEPVDTLAEDNSDSFDEAFSEAEIVA